MRRALVVFLSVLVLSLGLNSWASALQIQDIYVDSNTITSQNQEVGSVTLNVTEDYNETYLQLYPGSHDGYAIVNAQGKYFDKIVSFTSGPPSERYHALYITVTNTTPYTWSDYHFELWNTTFDWATPVQFLTSPPPDNNVFTNQSLSADNKVVKFWAPADVLPGGVVVFGLYLDGGSTSGSYGLRQVATTTPVPGSLLLLGSGLLGLLAFRRRQ
jgi:hypothetical protein